MKYHGIKEVIDMASAGGAWSKSGKFVSGKKNPGAVKAIKAARK
jgi:hypothetical protein